MDTRAGQEQNYERFFLNFDTDRSASTLAMEILEQYGGFTACPQIELDLRPREHKQFLIFNERPLGVASMASVWHLWLLLPVMVLTCLFSGRSQVKL